MYKPQRGGGSGGYKGGQGHNSGGFRGGNRFGDSKPWERGNDRGGSGGQMFHATCAECGKDCEVPFKPNGSRPIYCSWCFKKDGDDAPRRPSGGDSYKPSFSAAKPADNKANEQLVEQLRQVNSKLEAILKALTVNTATRAITADEHALDIVEAPRKTAEQKEKTKAKKSIKKKKA
jgi:CxxC-x17-CxxC domain-containing protein